MEEETAYKHLMISILKNYSICKTCEEPKKKTDFHGKNCKKCHCESVKNKYKKIGKRRTNRELMELGLKE